MTNFNFKSLTSTAAILVVACLAVGYFATRPAWSNYQDAQAKMSALSDTNQKLNDSLNSLESFLNSFHANSGQVSGMNLALPVKSADLTNFIASLGDMAQTSGVVLSNFSVDENNAAQTKPTALNAVQPVTVNLTASGNYSSFRDFMVRLENNLRLLDINHITLKADQDGLLEYQISFKTYYQK